MGKFFCDCLVKIVIGFAVEIEYEKNFLKNYIIFFLLLKLFFIRLIGYGYYMVVIINFIIKI